MLFKSGAKNARLSKPLSQRKEQRFNPNKGDGFWGISSQELSDRLIRIEPRLRGSTVWDMGQTPWRFQNRGSPSGADSDEPSHWIEACHTASLIFAGSSHPRWSPGIGGRLHQRSSPNQRSQGGEEAEVEVIGELEVLPTSDVARCPCATSSFVGRIYICKSQRTVMTP
jgi:hypothetical protein